MSLNRRNLDGVLILDKPKGISSNNALQIVKRLYRARKAGHTGSLDPIATGLLPICFGEATKFSQFLLDADKHYQVIARLGIRTDTSDAEGNVIKVSEPPQLSLSEMDEILAQFRGPILQVPSMYSALKYQGQPLYKLAREGITVPREARAITINTLTILKFEGAFLTLEIKASKGTYVRSLIDDLGEVLKCGAHVVELRRLGAGPYQASDMIELASLQDAFEQGFPVLDSYLLSADSPLKDMPKIILSETETYHIRQGKAIKKPGSVPTDRVRLYTDLDQFIGVGEITFEGDLLPRRLIQQVVSF